MSGTTRRIGFDRKIRLSWLDATAEWTAQGLSAAEIPGTARTAPQWSGGRRRSPQCARQDDDRAAPCLGALPGPLVPLRDDALALLRGRCGRDRLTLHWGMCLATYPFFRDVAATTGRLLALQGTAAMSQIVRRMAEFWGERSTSTRAVQRVVRSLSSGASWSRRASAGPSPPRRRSWYPTAAGSAPGCWKPTS